MARAVREAPSRRARAPSTATKALDRPALPARFTRGDSPQAAMKSDECRVTPDAIHRLGRCSVGVWITLAAGTSDVIAAHSGRLHHGPALHARERSTAVKGNEIRDGRRGKSSIGNEIHAAPASSPFKGDATRPGALHTCRPRSSPVVDVVAPSRGAVRHRETLLYSSRCRPSSIPARPPSYTCGWWVARRRLRRVWRRRSVR